MQELEKIMLERFDRDSILALATVEDGRPHVRNVDAWYHDGAFYSITYALSGKVRQIEKNPAVALAGEWYTAHGIAENLGWVGKEENRTLTENLRRVFAAWIDNGHTNFADENTIILRIRVTDAVLFSQGRRYEL